MGPRARRVAETGEEESGPSAEVVPGFTPESDLERRITSDPELVRGLEWGVPRSAHPEGSVARHISDLLATIEEWGESGSRRSELRLLALIHDSLKYRVDQRRPRTGDNHHATRARRFAERHLDDERLLSVIEYHDRPYQLWRRMKRTGQLQEEAFQAMLEAVPDPDLFVRFVELDGSTTGKDTEPIRWFREELERRGLVGRSG